MSDQFFEFTQSLTPAGLHRSCHVAAMDTCGFHVHHPEARTGEKNDSTSHVFSWIIWRTPSGAKSLLSGLDGTAEQLFSGVETGASLKMGSHYLAAYLGAQAMMHLCDVRAVWEGRVTVSPAYPTPHQPLWKTTIENYAEGVPLASPCACLIPREQAEVAAALLVAGYTLDAPFMGERGFILASNGQGGPPPWQDVTPESVTTLFEALTARLAGGAILSPELPHYGSFIHFALHGAMVWLRRVRPMVEAVARKSHAAHASVIRGRTDGRGAVITEADWKAHGKVIAQALR